MKLQIEDRNARMKLDYDYEAFNLAKKVPDSTYNYIDDEWSFDKKYLKHYLKELYKMNFSIEEELKIINEQSDQHIKFSVHDSDNVVKTVKLNILKENQKSLVIGFNYDPKVLEIIKQTSNRSYVATKKAWRVQKSEIDWLKAKLNDLGYIDISELDEEGVEPDFNDIEIDIASQFPKIEIKPHNYQIDTLKMLLKYQKVINSLEAGLGKTAITVMAAEYLKKKTLIICPATVKLNWRKEIYQINRDADVSVLFAKDEWKSAQYVILNYDIIDRFLPEIMKEGFDIVVYDEAHMLRGVTNSGKPSSKRAKQAIKISTIASYVFPITASPFVNYVKDIFNLLVLIDCPTGDNWFNFSNKYCGAEYNGYGSTFNGASKLEELNSRLYPNYMIRMKTEDHIKLPERTRSFIPVDINIAKYNKVVKDYMKNRNSLVTNGQHLVYLTAMRKELAFSKAKHAEKMAKDLLDQNKSVVIFTNYTSVVEYLYEKFPNDAVFINGDVDTKDRHELVEQFQSGEKKVFIGNIDAAGVGITLTKSHHMIIVDMHWSPVVMVNQVEKRLHRLSQTNTVLVNYLYVQESDLEMKQLSMLEKKLNDSSMILDGKEEKFFVDEIIAS
ncbi:DEAD/DEAH box helicase [Oceanobacillus kimchii]|uniref:DEAD/DEAH box helicase n=1 Tax=Oceanobacillus kimchii TaxID=746691 RepID=A0ABQ5TKB9_9BACI|nr:DEAD/DEAH box helicase [Oceanobacillus kimchii]GLO66191.1 hypothetical protein MACH08_19750 [Oceanobacillus kimchii]